MSGLAGFISRTSSEGSKVANMLDRQRYRGEKSKNTLSPAPHVHFGFTRHSLSSSQAPQPLLDPESRYAIVGDIRLDNRSELRNNLGLSNNEVSDRFDEELVLAAYLKWGQRCLQYLLGDFVFVVWDPKNAWLFIARDHFGVRQLAYASEGEKFVFATDVAGVLAGLKRSPAVSRRRLIDFHIDELEGASSSSTLYQGVFRLPAAHSLIVNSQLKIQVTRYWEMQTPEILKLGNDSEYLEIFEDLLCQAIDCRTHGVERCGAMLSGGLDSSSIVGNLFTREAKYNNSVPVYSGVIPGHTQGCDDTYFIRLIANYLEIEPRYVYPDSVELTSDELTQDPDSLFDAFMVMPQMIYQAANSDGVSVVLDGLFGDEILETNPKSYWHSLMVDKSNSILDVINIYRCASDSKDRNLFPTVLTKSLLLRYVPKGIHKQLAIYKLLIAQNKEIRLLALDLSLSEKLALAKKRKAVMQIGSDSFRSKKAAFFNHPFTQVALERYDRVAARNNVECRHPLLDKRLVEFCLSLPLNQTLRDGHSRWVLRKYMEKILPDEAVWRPKGRHLGFKFGSAEKIPDVAEHWQKTSPSIYVKNRYDQLIDPSRVDLEKNSEEVLAKRKVSIASKWLDAQNVEINTETIN